MCFEVQFFFSLILADVLVIAASVDGDMTNNSSLSMTQVSELWLNALSYPTAAQSAQVTNCIDTEFHTLQLFLFAFLHQ